VIAFEVLQSINNNSLHNRTEPGKTPENNEFQRLATSSSAAGSADFDSLSTIRT
jgi:hypothetical protein